MSNPRRWLAARVAALVAAVLSGCMFEPANETVLGSQGEAVTFRGVAATPRATVRIQAAAAPNGPFAQIASTQASGVPTLLGGATLYEFSVEVVVPAVRWAQTCDGSETFVRALGGNLVLTTYDSEAIAGVSGEECIDAEIGDGQLFVTAANTCASAYGAPARLAAPQGALSSTVLGRSLRIVNPHQAEDYACLSAINGDLRILDPSNTDLAFPALASVSGELVVRYPRAPADTESRLVDLPELASVGGGVRLESPAPPGPGQGGPLSIDFGLPALVEIGGALSIEFLGKGAGFDSVAGLPLVTHSNDLTLHNLSSNDTSYADLLPSLTEIDGDATLLLGLTCASVLEALEDVSGDLTVTVGTLVSTAANLGALAAVGGDVALQFAVPLGGELPSLESVGGSLAVEYFTSPPNFTPAPYLTSLADVDGELYVFDSEAPPVPGAAPLDVGSLVLDANPGLVDLADALSHVSVAPPGAITITDNPNITDCEAQDWVDGLPGNHPGPVTISGNGPC